MEKLKRSAAAKVIAVILAALTLTLTALSALTVAFMAWSGYYEAPLEEVKENIQKKYVDSVTAFFIEHLENEVRYSPTGVKLWIYDHALAKDAAFEVFVDGKRTEDFFSHYRAKRSDYERVTVYDTTFTDSGSEEDELPTDTDDRAPGTETSVDTNFETEVEPETEADPEAGYWGTNETGDAETDYDTGTVTEPAKDNAPPSPLSTPTEHMSEKALRIIIYLKKDSAIIPSIPVLQSIADATYGARYLAVAAVAVFAVLFIILFSFVLSAAGHRRTADGISLSMFDRIPFDLLIIIFAALTAVAVVFIGEVLTYVSYLAFDNLVSAPQNWEICVMAVGAILTFFADALLLMLVCMTASARIKTGSLLTYNITTHVIRLIVRASKAIYRLAKRAVMAIPTVWRTLVFSLLAAVISFYLCLFIDNGAEEAILFAVVLWAALVVLACYRAWCMSVLRRAGKHFSSGDLSYRLNTKGLFGDYRQHAEDLNNIGVGMENAVEERLKSERFRTELITNVSHDIRTPLTSIINYVDLLKSPDLDAETARSYVDVLDRQSQKLRRLTEDLIEASKASSGVLAVDLQPCDLSLILSQAAGEYGDRLEAAGLTPVVKGTDTHVTVMADGRHTARIIDNLISNAAKYSLPGTRVYLELVVSGGFAGISVTNISREPLDIDPKELKERFVRGDASRHTDGSGLGLSIAESLAEIQGGTLSLETNADLFRATLWFRVNN